MRVAGVGWGGGGGATPAAQCREASRPRIRAVCGQPGGVAGRGGGRADAVPEAYGPRIRGGAGSAAAAWGPVRLVGRSWAA